MHNLRKKITLFLLLTMLINIFSIFRIEALSSTSNSDQSFSNIITQEFEEDELNNVIPDFPSPNTDVKPNVNTENKENNTGNGNSSLISDGKSEDKDISGNDKEISDLDSDNIVDDAMLRRAPSRAIPNLHTVTPDTVYEKTRYYKESPLGIIGGFHIVAFNSVETRAHTNGNILANKLIYKSNFGTKGVEEVSYFRTLDMQGSGFNSTQLQSGSRLVVGTGINVGTRDGRWTLNGHIVDAPQYNSGNELWQDTNITQFIDLNKVKNSSETINRTLSTYKDINTTIENSNINSQFIVAKNSDGVNVYNWVHGAFSTGGQPINIKGLEKDKEGTLIINVDMKGRNEFVIPNSTYLYSDNTTSPTGEVVNWQGGSAIWNFYDSSKSDGIYRGVIRNSAAVTGLILAPGAEVDLKSNFNGTIIANKVVVEAESHRADFTGKSIDYPAEFEFTKIDKLKHGLPDAVFELRNQYNQVVTLKDMNGNSIGVDTKTDARGKLYLHKLSTGVYKLYEKTAPQGFQKINEPILQIEVDTHTGFKKVTRLHNSYNENDKTITNQEKPTVTKTKVTIEKQWVSYQGQVINKDNLKNLSIKVRLKRKVNGIIDNSFIKDIVLDYNNNWTKEITDLDIKDSVGRLYTYFVEEYDIPIGFTEISNNNEKEWTATEDGGTFTFKLKNRAPQPVYPNTGGIGSITVIVSGILLTFIGVYLRRKAY